MEQKVYLRLALPTPLRRFFDYLPPQGIDIQALILGSRVRVPFQNRQLIGVLVEIVHDSAVPENKLKRAIELLDEAPIFSQDVYKLCEWAAQYYHYAFGEVLSSALPGLLRKGQSIEVKDSDFTSVSFPTNLEVCLAAMTASDDLPKLNPEQLKAVNAICTNTAGFHPFLLDGVTGSGKTEVYLHAIAEILRIDKQVLVLLPEISLTPQTIARFRARFSVPIATFHSGLSEQERLQTWIAARAGSAKIIIGTRSAIFIPCKKLGLIIVDEEHDIAFKQQDRFRYHARDLAVMRAFYNHIPIVLGSATPSLESLLNVSRQRYQYLRLGQRAGKAELPQYQIIDLQRFPPEQGLSQPLLQAMREHLAENNQVMLFLNRRGFAPVLYCTQCAWIAGCKRCDARMVYHQRPQRLHCHHCDARANIPVHCPSCKEKTLRPIGLGTQRLEEVLMQHFPAIPIIRVDRDNTRRKNAMQKLLTQIQQEEKAILLGTQMLAKGHHFPRVTLVGIIDADVGLFSADFRAAEQMGQLLLQISGRAGRVEKIGTVIIQTRHPQHALLKTLIDKGYHVFAQELLMERKQAFLPPFSYFALFRAEAYAEQKANTFLEALKQMSLALDTSMTLLGPVSALIAKRKNLYCQHLLIKAETRQVLQRFLNKILSSIEKLPESKSVKWTLDVDPMEVF